MKKFLYLFFVLSLGLFAGCEEISPEINPQMGPNTDPDDPSPVEDQPRQVLIEEFTGVRCVNCPDGSEAIETLLNIHGEQLVAVSIHSSGSFSVPNDENAYDFRTTEGDNILSFLGEPIGYPTAVVNRKKFPDEFDLQLGKGQWAGYIAEEAALPPKVRIGIEPSYDVNSRDLSVDVALYVEETITGEARLSVMLLENDITDAQVTPDGLEEGYKHKHVLRDMLTNYDGDIIPEELAADAEIEKSFDTTIPADWVDSNVSIVVFVSLAGEVKDVLQAHQVKMVE